MNDQLGLQLAPIEETAKALAHPALVHFHEQVRAWFAERLGEPTEPQVRGWPLIRSGKSLLIAAPTGSGKTLAAFLACIDALFRKAAAGALPRETQILYVSPLKALGNDVRKNLLGPLEELRSRAVKAGLATPEIRVGLRTGDTTATERAALVARPPHILITTPESLYLYLTAAASRETLATVRTVVVDEIHALARDKRGSHFALSMERLRRVTKAPLQVIGLSATTRPLDALAQFLTGERSASEGQCELVEVGHVRPWELEILTPEEELTAVATHEMWGQVYDRLVALSSDHRTMLVFTNTRRLAERLAHDLGERLGFELVAAHHGSMAREPRLLAEQRLKAGALKILVATASLELGIDIGSIDLVVQVGSPRSIGVMLQRLGRSGHHKSRISKGLLIALTRDELVECAALLWAIHEHELDAIRQPAAPLDVLAQQLVAEVAAGEASEDELYEAFRRAAPYRELSRKTFDEVVHLCSEGVSASRGRSSVHLHRDRVAGRLRARRGAKLTAIQNGGAIPDLFSYRVIAEPEDKQVGTVDEDFAIDSMAGDIFVLGSTSWKIRRVAEGTVRVENANGLPPSIPFWRGEAPARSDELSARVSRLRARVETEADPRKFLQEEVGLGERDASFLAHYLQAAKAALGVLPTQQTVVAERFFDEAGGMQLIIHAPFGARVNRAWGLALRKCFCRAFDFELQAAASDDGILLSLGEQHSFPLVDIFDFVAPERAEHVVAQAVLQAPMFGARFRWVAGRALALTRQINGRRVPPPIQRARAEDLIAAVFPEQVGCQDNHGGKEIEPPDHPLVKETMKDCLRDFMDVDRLGEVLRALKDGSIAKRAVDLPEPSVLAHQMLNSAPYTFLDDAPLEERRTRAMAVRRTLPPADAADLAALDQSAIDTVIEDAAPIIRDADELHDTLLQMGIWPLDRTNTVQLQTLLEAGRAATVRAGGRDYVFARERVPLVAALCPDVKLALAPLPGDAPQEREDAVRSVVQGWTDTLGPVTASELSFLLGIPKSDVLNALARIEASGQVLRGHFRPSLPNEAEIEWCNRRLLQRIHRLTLGRLRREIEPLSSADFMRFLFRWHFLDSEGQLRGVGGLGKAVSLLQGYEAPASSWETELFPVRMKGYAGEWLENACYTGEVAWGRLTMRESSTPGPRRGVGATPQASDKARVGTISRSAALTFVKRSELDWMLEAARPGQRLDDGPSQLPLGLSHPARDLIAALEHRGASFFTELVNATRRLPAEVEDALWELLARGLVTGDAIQNLRILQSPIARRRQRLLQRGGPGRWSLLVSREAFPVDGLEDRLGRLFLNRYGIVFRDLVARETLAPPWSRLLAVYRRLEARGEIRGGRFLRGLAGEQFALPGAVEMARSIRRTPMRGERIRIAAVDPLNLTGIVTPGPRIAAIPGQFVFYVDGAPVDREGNPDGLSEEISLMDPESAEALANDQAAPSPG